MQWDIVPEILSALVILVVLFNSSDANSMPSARDKMFRFMLYYMIFCTALNILSTQTVYHAQSVPLWVNMVVNTAYFALYPPLPVAFIMYILLYIYELAPQEHRNRFYTLTTLLSISMATLLVIVGFNLKTGWLFSFSDTGDYIRGPLNQVSLVIAMFQICLGLVAIWIERSHLDKTFFNVILWLFPLSITIIILQILFPDIILTGTAIMLAMLSVYLSFQTRRISIDPLTQYPNRDSFISNLEHSKRFNRKIVVVVVSLDDFKLINDTYGQKRGDQFLKSIAQGLQDLIPHGQVYRYAGDVFAIITDSKHGQNLTEVIMNRFSQTWYVEGVSTRVRASLVLLELPYKADPSVDPLTLLDHALRTAKNRGKGQLVYCDAILLKTIRRKNQLIDRLMQAISQDALSLEFQPIIELTSKKMRLAEALLRWEDPELGRVAPSEFIPLAEELGIIGELGRWVLEQVCQMLDEFHTHGLTIPSISVNFSGLQFADTHIVSDILGTLERYRIPPEAIHIELTESTFIGASYQEALHVMNPLIERGIRFHLDDFGTGYSNLSYMVNLPFHCIKLDRSLLWDVKHRNKTSRFVKSIIKAVQEMGFRVIVEGVENEQQVSYLEAIPCDLVQGYFFSPPLTKKDLFDYVKRVN